jgi:hypothetical protein
MVVNLDKKNFRWRSLAMQPPKKMTHFILKYGHVRAGQKGPRCEAREDRRAETYVVVRCSESAKRNDAGGPFSSALFQPHQLGWIVFQHHLHFIRLDAEPE